MGKALGFSIATVNAVSIFGCQREPERLCESLFSRFFASRIHACDAAESFRVTESRKPLVELEGEWTINIRHLQCDRNVLANRVTTDMLRPAKSKWFSSVLEVRVRVRGQPVAIARSKARRAITTVMPCRSTDARSITKISPSIENKDGCL
jgi:hypothetical protein